MHLFQVASVREIKIEDTKKASWASTSQLRSSKIHASMSKQIGDPSAGLRNSTTAVLDKEKLFSFSFCRTVEAF